VNRFPALLCTVTICLSFLVGCGDVISNNEPNNQGIQITTTTPQTQEATITTTTKDYIAEYKATKLEYKNIVDGYFVEAIPKLWDNKAILLYNLLSSNNSFRTSREQVDYNTVDPSDFYKIGSDFSYIMVDSDPKDSAGSTILGWGLCSGLNTLLGIPESFTIELKKATNTYGIKEKHFKGTSFDIDVMYSIDDDQHTGLEIIYDIRDRVT